jgi:hypothetical protein
MRVFRKGMIGEISTLSFRRTREMPNGAVETAFRWTADMIAAPIGTVVRGQTFKPTRLAT